MAQTIPQQGTKTPFPPAPKPSSHPALASLQLLECQLRGTGGLGPKIPSQPRRIWPRSRYRLTPWRAPNPFSILLAELTWKSAPQCRSIILAGFPCRCRGSAVGVPCAVLGAVGSSPPQHPLPLCAQSFRLVAACPVNPVPALMLSLQRSITGAKEGVCSRGSFHGSFLPGSWWLGWGYGLSDPFPFPTPASSGAFSFVMSPPASADPGN